MADPVPRGDGPRRGAASRYQRCGRSVGAARLGRLADDHRPAPRRGDPVLRPRARPVRGEGFIEMFDKHPSAHATLEDFMDALGEASGRPIVRNILLAATLTRPQPASQLPRLARRLATSAACAHYGMALHRPRPPTFITFDDWSLWDGAPRWNRVMNGTPEARVRAHAGSRGAGRLRQEEIDTKHGAAALARAATRAGVDRARHRRWRRIRAACSVGKRRRDRRGVRAAP